MPDPIYTLEGKRVWVAGHRGMVGQALVQRLASEACEILTVDRQTLDLRRQVETEAWLKKARPDTVFLAAARVGGILANDSYPGSFLYDNLTIAMNVMEASRQIGIEKLLFLGSSCIYPKHALQPIREEVLLSGPLEPTNEWYAIAKIAGLKLAQAYRRQHGCDFIVVQPANLYGPGDNFDPKYSHVPAGLIRRFHEAKVRGAGSAIVWGTGKPRREFLYVADLADACVFLMRHYSDEGPINVGTGQDVTILEFAQLIAQTVGYRGEVTFDSSLPDGTPRKLLDVSRLEALGWRATTPLKEGLKLFYQAFLEAEMSGAKRLTTRYITR